MGLGNLEVIEKSQKIGGILFWGRGGECGRRASGGSVVRANDAMGFGQGLPEGSPAGAVAEHAGYENEGRGVYGRALVFIVKRYVIEVQVRHL